MTYRIAAEGCQHCDELAFDRCTGCGGGQCLRHAVTHGARCPDCEHAFHAQLATIRVWRWRLLGLMAALPLLPLLTLTVQSGWRTRMWAWGALPTGLAMFDAAVMTLLVGFGLGHGMFVLRRRFEARRFQGC